MAVRSNVPLIHADGALFIPDLAGSQTYPSVQTIRDLFARKPATAPLTHQSNSTQEAQKKINNQKPPNTLKSTAIAIALLLTLT